nr:TIGR04255 family protein [Clostridia bacterium]
MQSNKETIKYEKHFLSSVICRIDFESDLNNETLSNLAMSTEITDYFQIRGKDTVEEATNFNVVQKPGTDPQIFQEKVSFVRKEFINSSGKNKCSFSPKFLILEYGAYVSFEELKKHFMKIVQKIKSLSGDIQISRFGLRYINTFNVDSFRVFKSYFANEISGFVSLSAPTNTLLSRAMGKIEYINSDIRLNMNFGEFNRNYPGAIEKHDFVLDYDAFIQGNYKLSDAFPQKLEIAHNMIQDVFENSITDKLREVMK